MLRWQFCMLKTFPQCNFDQNSRTGLNSHTLGLTEYDKEFRNDTGDTH